MNSWIFYMTDSLGSMSAVVGIGTDIAEAEAAAHVKWDALASGRPDYAERSPIAGVIYSTISTKLNSDDMPGLIL